MDFYGYVDMPIVKDKRLYHIALPVGAPYTECLEVLDEAKAAIQELIDKEAEAARAKEAQGQEAVLEAVS